MNKEEEIKRLKKIELIISLLPESNSIRDISKKTKIPESTIQKLLHKPVLIAQALGLNNDPETINEITTKIQEWFIKNKKEGSKRGAIISHTISSNHPTIKRK